MNKNGHCNIKHRSFEKSKKFMTDFFTTMVDLKVN